MDCKYETDGNTDFWGKNVMHKKNKTLSDCESGLRFIKDFPHRRTIINCSDNKIFSVKENIEDVVERYKEYSESREYWVGKLIE
jgi:uncharacterized protein YlzI (FlbEa/FlbD family)